MEEVRIHSLSVPEEVVENLEEVIEEGDWLLIKGSRRMRMERIVEELVNRLGKA
jgi:UDP-N-acetylmuramyl pentapeptide synthase